MSDFQKLKGAEQIHKASKLQLIEGFKATVKFIVSSNNEVTSQDLIDAITEMEPEIKIIAPADFNAFTSKR